MRSTIATDSILSELVQNKQDILWCWWPHSADQWPGPRGLTHSTLKSHQREISALAAWPRPAAFKWSMGVQSSGLRRPSQVDKDRVIACWLWTCPGIITEIRLSWREYCPLCGSVMWIYVQAFHGLAVTLSQNNNIVIRLWPLTHECLHRSRWIMDNGGISQFLLGPIIVCSQASLSQSKQASLVRVIARILRQNSSSSPAQITLPVRAKDRMRA